MLDYSELCWLIGQEKELLIALIGRLVSRVCELEEEKPVELPELPSVGQYIIRDSQGGVRAMHSENEVFIDQVEGMAILFSLAGYAAIQFCLGDRAPQLMSEWSNGRKVERC